MNWWKTVLSDAGVKKCSTLGKTFLRKRIVGLCSNLWKYVMVNCLKLLDVHLLVPLEFRVEYLILCIYIIFIIIFTKVLQGGLNCRGFISTSFSNRFSGLLITKPSWPPAAPTGGSTSGTSVRLERSSHQRMLRMALLSCWWVVTMSGGDDAVFLNKMSIFVVTSEALCTHTLQ